MTPAESSAAGEKKDKSPPKPDFEGPGDHDNEEEVVEVREKFSPEEEASLLNESNEKKAEANALFTSAKYESAITKYEEAASTCPHYLDYELAVLQSNIAACHLKLDQWKEAISIATKAVESLGRAGRSDAEAEELAAKLQREEDEVEDEIVSAGAQNSAPAATPTNSTVEKEVARRKKRRDDILRIRAKALMRRARARSELGGWSDLSGAEEDYKALAAMANLSAPDRKIVRAQLGVLPARTKEAQEKEMGEMWGKLKDLGNGILKPFGLSTDNFAMVKDEKTGGYSMSFNQGDQQ